MRTMGYMPTEMELIELSQQINMNRESLPSPPHGPGVDFCFLFCGSWFLSLGFLPCKSGL